MRRVRTSFRNGIIMTGYQTVYKIFFWYQLACGERRFKIYFTIVLSLDIRVHETFNIRLFNADLAYYESS